MNNHGAPPRPKKVKFIMEKERQYLNPKDVQMVIYHKGCQDGLAAAACVVGKLLIMGQIIYRNFVP